MQCRNVVSHQSLIQECFHKNYESLKRIHKIKGMLSNSKGTGFSPCSREIDLTAVSVQFSRSFMSDSLRPHELQHTRPPCPSPTPIIHPNSCIESVMPSSHLILCRPLLLLPPIPPSIRFFSYQKPHQALLTKWRHGPRPPLILQARTWDERVRPCNSDLFFSSPWLS